MGQRVDLVDGTGYLAAPDKGAGPAVVVVADRSGPAEDVCDRLAAEGFTALTPDAAQRAGGGLDHLGASDLVRGDGAGLVGFGTGTPAVLALAGERPHDVKACVLFDPVEAADWSALETPVQCHVVDGEDEEVARTAWVRTLEFLRAKLG